MTVIYVIGGIVGFMTFISMMSVRKEKMLRANGMLPEAANASDEHVLALAKAGHKIEAIKLYRQMRNTSLYDAKQAVEKMTEKAP